MSKPIVAIVGRPNVEKSTFFIISHATVREKVQVAGAHENNSGESSKNIVDCLFHNHNYLIINRN